MRIVFMGTAEFGIPSLKTMVRERREIVAVVTAPDKPKGRGLKTAFTSVKMAALEMNLPLLQPADLKEEEFIQTLHHLKPDVIVVIAFRILPKEVFTIARIGAFNLHASLLPKYRGAAPIQRAIMNGESETGVTTFFLKDTVDTGEIIVQKKIKIGDEETAGEVHDRLAVLGAEAVTETLCLLEKGAVRALPQNDALASNAPKIFKDDCRIQWNQTAIQIKNFVRALSPHPGAIAKLNGQSYKLYRVSISTRFEGHNQIPGTIIATDIHRGIFVSAGNGETVLIEEIQPASKKRMHAAEFLRGYSVNLNDRFE